MRILIAVENEHYGQAQIDFVVNHKWPEKVMFNVLHVVEPTMIEDYPGHQTDEIISQIAALKMEKGENLVKDVANQLRKSFASAVIVEDVQVGYPKDTILEAVNSWEADVVVVGSHGRRDIGQIMAGSVSSAVLTYAQCSVFVVRPSEAQQQARNQSRKARAVSAS